MTAWATESEPPVVSVKTKFTVWFLTRLPPASRTTAVIVLCPLVATLNGSAWRSRLFGVVATNSICNCTLVLLGFTAVITAGPALLAETVTLALPVPSVLTVAALKVPRVVEKLIGAFATPVAFCCH